MENKRKTLNELRKGIDDVKKICDDCGKRNDCSKCDVGVLGGNLLYRYIILREEIQREDA